ncbi:hypothetical protein BGX28_007978 [Mortierella sp. GBA30]|nr:hypothetical protein BGX28_007978 [Mortierella sp. GBA30]
MSSLQSQRQRLTAVSLAPEIILHILSFLGDHREDRPFRFWPILTLCKSWARLALELMYEQPVLTLKSLEPFIDALELQDRLQNGQMPFWDPNYAATPADPSPGSSQRKSLGIDYRAMIKKPCRIIGDTAPSKQVLIQLWDLQALLWTVPAFSGRCSSSSSMAVQAPVLPSPPLSSCSASSISITSSPSFSPTSATFPASLPEDSSSPFTASAPVSTTPPSSSKVVLVRRKKKPAPLPGPVVMLFDLSQSFSDTMLYILQQVPGMSLRKIQYRWLLRTPLPEILENQVGFLQEIIFWRPHERPGEFDGIPQVLARASHLHTLRFDHCYAAGAKVLSDFAHGCGASLKVLEIRQPNVLRIQGNHSRFPVDGPQDWNLNPADDFAAFERTLQEAPGSLLGPGQTCSWCGILQESDNVGVPLNTPVCDIESQIENLSISEETNATTNEQHGEDEAAIEPPLDIALAHDIPASRMDLAMFAFAEKCPRLRHLSLLRATWLSDECLAGFRPPPPPSPPPSTSMNINVSEKSVSGSNRLNERQYGLSVIEILDSHYESRVTIEGILDLCGPDLEVLIIDRKSCWRTRPLQESSSVSLCCTCTQESRMRQTRLSCMSTGDRLIWGLLQKSHLERVCRLQRLELEEHWVSVDRLREAMERWLLSLRRLSLRLYKCSVEDLTDALIPIGASSHDPVLETLLLGLPWMDSQDPAVVGLIDRLFLTHKCLHRIEINKKAWKRMDVESTPM